MFGRKYNSGQSLISRHKKLLGIVICIIASILILGSLCSYHAFDATWFYTTTAPRPYINMFGIAGAHIAALLFYCMGGASFLILGIIWHCMWFIIADTRWREKWELAIAWPLLIACIACVSYGRHTDFIAYMSPGGLLGKHAFTLFSFWFDTHALLFTYCMASIACLFIFSFAIIPFIIMSMITLRFLTDAQRVWMPLARALVRMGRIVYMISRAVVSYMHYVLSGAMVQEKQSAIFEFDYQLEEEQGQEAWNAARVLEHVQLEAAAPISFDQDEYQEDLVDISFEQPAAPVAQAPVEAERAPLSPVAAFINTPLEQTPYMLPAIDIFIGVPHEQDDRELAKELEKRAHILEEKLQRFGVTGSVCAIKRGPVVTVYEYKPDIDSKLSKILALEDDLALALQALSIRIIAPIPGKAVVGFEVANTKRKNVSFAKVIKSSAYQQFSGALPLLLGEDTIGADVVVDLARMPHLLIAGSTGSGKSVALNGMLMSLLCYHRPDEMKLILIDPKRLEFAPYADIPHLLFPIVTDSKKVAPILRYVVQQMEERYESMARAGARNIFDYHALSGNKIGMPFMVVVIDELADLMMTAGREIEDLIARIAQMARAAGIHMLVATQRPSVDVITGLIKVNFPSRISFRVTSKIDSRTILDCSGADKLLGRGDMLFLDSSSASMKRVHGAYVSDAEINQVVSHLRAQQKPEYVQLPPEHFMEDQSIDQADDALFKEVISFLETVDEISISLLQRKFRIGYNRSARIIEILESQGMILPSQGGKTRKVVR